MHLGLCFSPTMMDYVLKGFAFTPELKQYVLRETGGSGWRRYSQPMRFQLCILYLFELAYDLCLDQDHVLSEAPAFESVIGYQYHLLRHKQVEKAFFGCESY